MTSSLHGGAPVRTWAALAIVAAWIAWLAVPGVLALPMWTWTPRTGLADGGGDAGTLAMLDASRALALGAAATVLALAIAGRYAWFAWLTLPFALLVPAEAFYIVTYGESSSAHVLGLLLESNLAEAAEFAGGSVVRALVAYAGLAVVVAAGAAALSRLDRRLPRRARAWLAALGASVLAVLALPLVRADPGTAATQGEPRDGWHAFVDDFGDVFPWGVPIRAADYAVERRRIVEQARIARAERTGARAVVARAPVDVVLVIGESARADRFGGGTHAARTSPRLSALEGAYFLDDVVTPAPVTRLAVPRIVASGLRDGGGHVGGPSIVAVFREAGYRTWWISNHNTVGRHDDTIAPFAEEAEVRRFVNPGVAHHVSAFDGALASELERALAAPAERRFVVLHMLGSHFNYRLRYPDAFDRFQPSLGRDEPTSIYDVDRRDAIRNAYDNSVLYTDHVLAELIGILGRTGRPSVLVFVADHGQVLFEGLCGKAGHGVPSALAYRVPMLAWLSPAVRAMRPDAVDALAANRKAPLTLEAAAPTLADLGGLAIPGAPGGRSAASPSLRSAARRVTTDGRRWIDFDRDLPALDCATAIERAGASRTAQSAPGSANSPRRP